MTSVNAVAKIVLLCAAGAYLEKAGILHKEKCEFDTESIVKVYGSALMILHHVTPAWSISDSCHK